MKQRSAVHSDGISWRAGVLRNARARPALIDSLKGAHSLNEFLDDFPAVTREIATAALEQAKASVIADASVA